MGRAIDLFVTYRFIKLPLIKLTEQALMEKEEQD